jgi:hypothetical protein
MAGWDHSGATSTKREREREREREVELYGQIVSGSRNENEQNIPFLHLSTCFPLLPFPDTD